MVQPRDGTIGQLAREGAFLVGVGNRLRGDDGVGPVIAGRLARLAPARAVDAGSVPENWLGPLLEARPAVVVFVDAADHGAAPGAWRLVPTAALAERASSTHAASLALLAGLLEREGIRTFLLAIQPSRLTLGAPLSAPVRATAHALTRTLARALLTEGRHA
jgi:hydrogenase 3 maturation protease